MPTKPVLRQLGKNGPMVTAMGLGLMGLSQGPYGSIPSDEERFKFLDRAFELGETFWDTSDLYGDSEELIGKWFKRTGKRDQIFLATKYGFIKGDPTRQTESSYEYTKKACDENLRCLGIDCIDLYYLHSVNPEVPIEESMRALKELQEEGKIKYIGLSTVSSATLRRAVKIAPVTAVQTIYSVFSRQIEGPAGTNLLATSRELGVGVVIATPLGRGLITDDFGQGAAAYDDIDVRPKLLPHFQAENRERNVAVVARFKALADRKGCTASQLALAWLLAQGDDIFPIPGTKRIAYLEQNWAALDVVLTADEEKEIRAFVEGNQVAGGDVPKEFESHIFRDTKEL
ncbi:putative aldo-keto reductase, partial [Hypoxylon crocopeplum]